MIKKSFKNSGIALSQIIVLILGTIAFAYIVGIGQIPVVSADICTSQKCVPGNGNVVPSNCLQDCYARYDCSDVGGTSCTTGQTCNGNIVQTLNVQNCCLGSCKSVSSSQSSQQSSASSSNSNLADGKGCGYDSQCSSGHCNTANEPNPFTCGTSPNVGDYGTDYQSCLVAQFKAGNNNAEQSCAFWNSPAQSASPLLTKSPSSRNLMGSVTPGSVVLNGICDSTDTPSDCAAGLECTGSGTSYTCQTQQNANAGTTGVGGTCDSTKNPSDCKAGLQCTDGTCQAEKTPTLNGSNFSLGAEIGGIITAAGYAGAVYAGFEVAKSLFGVQPGSQTDMWVTAFQFAVTGAVFGASLPKDIVNALGGQWASGAIFAGIAIIAFLLLYKQTKQDTVYFTCIPWQPPVGGNDCAKCGQDGLPCTSYQCASLGAGCQLLNAQGTGRPTCVWVNSRDVTPPTINFLGSVLPTGYQWQPINAQFPGSTGVKITVGSNGNIPPYTVLPIGVTTDKVSKCNIDVASNSTFSDMPFSFPSPAGGISGDEGVWGINHTMEIPILMPQNGSATALQSGQTEFFVKCENANGVADVGAFVIEFNVDQGPDLTPPDIVSTNIVNGAPVAAGTYSTNVSVAVNEPVNLCKWSHTDQDINTMENFMDCSNANSIGDMNSQGNYICIANLTGIKINENDFYFKCGDLSGNNDTQSYKFSLTGTQPLVISSVTPNGTTIQDSTTSVHVILTAQTTAGANQGQATCYYSTTGSESDYAAFSNTSSYQSMQDLWLSTGSYTYYVKCVDLGGNADYAVVNFGIQTITTPPIVTRVYHDGSNLDIATDRNSTCVYDIIDCTYPFETGTPMTTTDNIIHSTAWSTDNTFYVKCMDPFGNQPNPSSCSIIVQPSQS